MSKPPAAAFGFAAQHGGMAASPSASSAAAAADAGASTYQCDVWHCGSCVVLDDTGADIEVKLFARMGQKGKPTSEHQLALFAVTKDKCYGGRTLRFALVWLGSPRSALTSSPLPAFRRV